MSLFQRGGIWWYEFWFAGRRIRETAKTTSKTLARQAEDARRRELEQRFNNFADTRHERVRTIADIADQYYDDYELRLPQSAVFAKYAVGHIKRLLGSRMLVDLGRRAFSSTRTIDFAKQHQRRRSTRKLVFCFG